MTPARRRAVGLVLVGVVLAIVCTFLGRWQWHRHEWRDAQIATVERNYDATPVPLAEVVPEPSAALAGPDEWRQVVTDGRYLPGATVLLRNRPVDGAPAYHVLVPFEVASTGDVLVVDRGWVPTGADASAAVDVPEPPAGDVRVVVQGREEHLAADALCEHLEPRLGASRHHDGGTPAGELLADRDPQPAGRARHQRAAAGL